MFAKAFGRVRKALENALVDSEAGRISVNDLGTRFTEATKTPGPHRKPSCRFGLGGVRSTSGGIRQCSASSDGRRSCRSIIARLP
jgi:hypothetical protein